MSKEKCIHEDNCIYDELMQTDGKPHYNCHCGDCGQKFIIWLEEGKNEDITDDDYDGDKYRKPCDVQYHIFSDECDEYESSLEKALEIVSGLQEDGKENIRIYKQTEWLEDDGIFEDGDCIFSLGSFPS